MSTLLGERRVTGVQGSDWVRLIEWATGVLTIRTHSGSTLRYGVDEWEYLALLDRTTTKRNKAGNISVGSAVNEFVRGNKHRNLDNIEAEAEARVDAMSLQEQQATWMVLVNRNLHGA